MKILTKIDPISTAKIFALIWTVSSFIMGVFVVGTSSFLSAFSNQFFTQMGFDVSVYLLYGWTAVITMPIIQGIVGFIIGLVIAWTYNYTAKWVGEIKIELK